MSQLIIDNAAAISFERELTVSTTTSQSRNTKYFRKGPVQSTAEVTLNVVRQSVAKQILGAVSGGLLGPYNLQFPSDVVGTPSAFTITINGANQSGDTVSVNSTGNQTILKAGDIISLPGTSGTFVVTADVSTPASGDTDVPLDHPMASSPTDAGTVAVNSDVTFSMLMVERPRASQGPTGLVAHDGSFRFVEDL